ncbi:hypothetical protein HPB47_015866 [Ixodes persulcatus]|uniref:Uncharacterized protein n=1 Tax=Ixodes persulcatus TaxID=34615 RepID=A0AC60QSA7_IXOPE|nr:hypothetical protein HPB47_015866 [Ixodes persulcatus]
MPTSPDIPSESFGHAIHNAEKTRAEVRDEHSDLDDCQHDNLRTEARDTATSNYHGLAPDGPMSGVFDFQVLMQAVIRTVVHEALEGVAQLFQNTQSPQRHPPTEASNVKDGRLTTTSAQFVPVYDPGSDTPPMVEAWLNKGPAFELGTLRQSYTGLIFDVIGERRREDAAEVALTTPPKQPPT